MARLELTATVVKNLECPDDKKRLEYCDTIIKGFLLECRRTNKLNGTYYLRWKNASNKTAYTKLGTQKTISFQRARELALERKAEIAKGVNVEVKTKMPTLNEFFVEVYLPRAKLHQRSWATTEGIFRRHLKPKLGDYPMDKITLKDVESIHSSLRESGLAPASADHAAKQIRAIGNAAVRHGVLRTNSIKNVKLFNEDNTRNDILTESQLSRLLMVLDTHHNQRICSIIKWLASTGCRSGEALSARWEDIHEIERTWVIPAARNKSKRVRSVPLSGMALKVLSSLDTKEERGYLFVNPKTNKPYVTVNKTWCNIRETAGLPWCRKHSLRHNYASILINSGRSLYEVQQILGHSDPKVTQRYAHLSTKSLQAAADSASDFMMAALKKAS